MLSSAFFWVGLALLGTLQYCTIVRGAVNFVPVGCYHDTQLDPRPLPELVKNYRVPGPEVMDWNDLNRTVVEKCALEASKKHYSYFGIQFWGECWSGPEVHVTYARDGKSNACYKGVGKDFANMVYRLVGPEKECLHYSSLSSADRSILKATTGTPKCDHHVFNFKPGWYRFEGEAGTKMPETCGPGSHCGTRITGWLSGSHPSVANGTVSRKVCFSQSLNECCISSIYVNVRNCGEFFVYKLKSAPGCRFRYCGNGIPANPVPTINI